jgi:crotonobetainyl-CoA:carnitine CoA-transferase CaiB-like acyl-CoA transferase
MNKKNKLPLERYTVLDLTIARAGPVAVRLLSDWGAKVIKIDPPLKSTGSGSVTGKRRGSDEQNLHRNKRGLTIDLKHPEGKRLFLSLVKQSDIVVENFKSDVKNRLGIDYDILKKYNPRIILGSISGFGQEGPYKKRAGVDQIIQGMSGLMSITGYPGDGPVRAGIAVSDTSAGMYLGQGILLALLYREQTGRGQWVHTSLLESMLSKLDFQAARYTMDGEVPEQKGNSHPTQVPMGTFAALDGIVNIAASTKRMFEDCCHALNAEHLLQDQSFATSTLRKKNRVKLESALNEVTRHFSVSDIVSRLGARSVPAGPINNIEQAFTDPHVRELKMTRKAKHHALEEINLVRSPINFSAFEHPDHFERAGPDIGEHNKEILQDFGFSAEEIDALEEKHII